MAKQYDLKDLGEVYGNLGKETAVLAEDTQSLTVGDVKAGIGSADILPGGPTKEGGFEEPTVDVTKCGDKNPYNVKAYSYGADNDPGVGAEEPAPTGEDALHGEEDEEGKKPDADGDGVPDWADKKPGKDDHAKDKKKKDHEEEEDEDEEVQEEGLGAIAGKIVRGTGKVAGKVAGKAAGVGAKVAGKAAAAGAKVAGKAAMGAGKAAIKGLDKAGQIADRGISKLAGDEEDKDEENEESSEKDLEIAREGLNTFMANKSVFDRLYNKVMVNENFGEMEEMDDLAALGIDDAAPDAEGEDGDSEEEVTITLDKDMAQHLCDILKAACGEDDDVEVDEVEDGEGHHEEDEEGEPHAMNTHYNDGKSNKVGNVTGLGGSGGSADTGSTAEVLHHKVNDGKSNKVGNLGDGFGQPKVEPMNKSVKA